MLKKASLFFCIVAYLLFPHITPFFLSIHETHRIDANTFYLSIPEMLTDYGIINSSKISLNKENYTYQKKRKDEMKTIGLLGGMTWHSTIEYYRLINQMIGDKLGDYHSAHLILYSVDFAPVERVQLEGRWDDAASMLKEAAIALKKAGADFIVICANTMHKVADEVEEGSGLPVLHIADATGEEIKKQGLRKVGLLGTRFTMEEDFIRGRLKESFNLEVIIPDEKDRNTVNRIIYEELGKGIIKESSRKAYVEVIHRLAESGAEGIILGCTEIPLLIRPGDVDMPLFNTTKLHAEAAVEKALSAISQN